MKLTTDEGLVGWGEPIIEGRTDTVIAALLDMEQHIINHDPNRIEDLWQILYRGGFYRGGPILMSAIAGIDQALWDIKGKRLGVPVYDLLGGPVRDKMLVYPWVSGDRPSNVAQMAKEKQSQGFKAVKMNGTQELEWIDSYAKVNQVVERIRAIREACGLDFGIGIDFHGRVHKTMAKMMMHALEPYHPMFVEEPVLFENYEYFKELASYAAIPVATGERCFSRWDFKRLFEQKVVDIVQPDLSHAGGISEVKKIAAMAEAHDMALAPHCPLGPIAFASSLQVDFTCVNAMIQETSLNIHYNRDADVRDYLRDSSVFDVKDGYISRMDQPGLGIEIDEEKVREAAKTGHNWKNPVWRTPSGVVAEW